MNPAFQGLAGQAQRDEPSTASGIDQALSRVSSSINNLGMHEEDLANRLHPLMRVRPPQPTTSATNSAIAPVPNFAPIEAALHDFADRIDAIAGHLTDAKADLRI